MTLQQIISTIRELKDMSQKELAEKVGISRPAVTQFETGRATLSQETILKIAAAIGLNQDYVLRKSDNVFLKSDEVIKLIPPHQNERILAYVEFLLSILPLVEINIIRERDFSIKAYALILQDVNNNIYLIMPRIPTYNYLHKDSSAIEKTIKDYYTYKAPDAHAPFLYSKTLSHDFIEKIKYPLQKSDIIEFLSSSYCVYRCQTLKVLKENGKISFYKKVPFDKVFDDWTSHMENEPDKEIKKQQLKQIVSLFTLRVLIRYDENVYNSILSSVLKKWDLE